MNRKYITVIVPLQRKMDKESGHQQCYKCHACGKQFTECNKISKEQLWQEYVEGKQTYYQLTDKYRYPLKTTQRKLDEHKFHPSKPVQRPVIVLMDTTYWGQNFGVMLFKNAWRKENLQKYYVRHETNTLYIQSIEELELRNRGFTIVAIVCERRKTLRSCFEL